jgi:hypothetical protein
MSKVSPEIKYRLARVALNVNEALNKTTVPLQIRITPGIGIWGAILSSIPSGLYTTDILISLDNLVGEIVKRKNK